MLLLLGSRSLRAVGGLVLLFRLLLAVSGLWWPEGCGLKRLPSSLFVCLLVCLLACCVRFVSWRGHRLDNVYCTVVSPDLDLVNLELGLDFVMTL